MKLDLSVVGREFKPVRHTYLWKDVVIYHLGIGARATELDYVYEGLRGGIKVIPSFAVVAAMEAAASVLPPARVDIVNMLHGEQTIRMHAPIPPSGVFLTTPKVAMIRDKGKHALLDIQTITTNQDGLHLFEALVSLVCRGQGGFSDARSEEDAPHLPPADRDPDFTSCFPTSPDQAALYRLSGDLNPLHINPAFAQTAGYDRPILHGLAVYGGILKILIANLGEGDVTRVKEYKARFARPIYPGDGITVKAWRMGQGVYAVEAATDREVVINHAYVKFDRREQ
jgi:acyl dehydratase